MSNKIWGPRIFEQTFQGKSNGFDIVYTQADLDTMGALIDPVKQAGKLKIRQGRSTGKWYTEIIDGRQSSSEIEVQKHPDEQETQEKPLPPPSDAVDFDNLPF